MSETTSELATFGAGCFWGVEEEFRTMEGVLDTMVGYEGGHLDNPTYRDVCTDRTGHAEVVQVTFDPTKISYEALVIAFFGLHDPTTKNRQGPDVGTQYRSAVFVHSEAQKAVVEKVIAELSEKKVFARPIVTTIEPAQTFYKAEEYHQRYLEKRGLSSCHL